MNSKVPSRFGRFFMLTAGALFLLSGIAFAQDTGSDVNLDDLFGGDMVTAEQNSPAPSQNAVTSALKSDKVRIGGSFSGSLGAAATWNNPWDGSFDLFNADKTEPSAQAKATVFFDARPDEDFRVYGSLNTSWPYAVADSSGDNSIIPNVSVFELFTDFSWNDQVFFRFGKSTVKWGTGYFWSPADVINLEPINIFDPTSQRAGPLNLKIHVPVLGTQNNFYFYTILDEKNLAFSTTALAGKAEFLLGKYELGIGGYYRYDTAERGMLTLTGPLGDFDIFGEAMISRGSAKTFVTDISVLPPFTVSTSEVDDHRSTFYASASAGFMYSNQNSNVSAVGQYYYNGEGYSDTTRTDLIGKATTVIAALGGAATVPGKAMAQALSGLLFGSGRHYAALSLSKSKFLSDDFSLSILALANLSDFSGIIRPQASWKIIDRLSVTASPMFIFGGENTEYASLFGGDILAFSVSVSIGSGSF
ncbi:MAG: hypothetical protein LWX00_09970 [Spirochaetia bacterium]|nr:hypothetical protein [Spirochaetia bacterium]